MSILGVRNYFVDVMETLEYEEHKDAFNDQDIASVNLDKGFHVLVKSGTNLKYGNLQQEITTDVEVKFFVKGFLDTLEAMTSAMNGVDDVIKESMSITRRTTDTNGVRNVLFTDFSIDPIGESNDNFIKATVRFRAIVLMLT